MDTYRPDSGPGDALVTFVVRELREQQHRLLEAEIKVSVCRYWVEHERGRSRARREDLCAAGVELENVKRCLWPKSVLDMLATIERAVQCEFSERPSCSSCKGCGSRMLELRRILCPECAGTGVAGRSDRKRAASIGRDESTYRAKWRLPYEWIYERVENSASFRENVVPMK